MSELSPDERVRRLRAAHAYSGMSRTELAEALNVSPSTLDFMEGKRSPARPPDERTCARAAVACGLPVDFFTADLWRLHELEPASSAADVSQQRAAAMSRLRQLEAERARRIRERYEAPRDTTPARRRRKGGAS